MSAMNASKHEAVLVSHAGPGVVTLGVADRYGDTAAIELDRDQIIKLALMLRDAYGASLAGTRFAQGFIRELADDESPAGPLN
ncbi:hypothetical protein [Azorhizobium caulinodans]|nr:hypothetical protein [Azorhizobium caulinodans]